ncbi:MAG: acyltransferase, partial [Pirellulaceae bacterium]|nr:acyltransferase [Pirellulaceae bacterium]
MLNRIMFLGDWRRYFPQKTVADKGRIQQLDCLRAVACGMVLIAHLDSVYGFPELPPEMGAVGVAIFFALSGYLITRGIISDTQAGTFSLRAFFNKRATRILPAYFLLLAVVTLFWPGKENGWCASFSFNFLYVSGARDYFHVQQLAGSTPPVGHLWSICVEEHYYWLWPLVILCCSPRVAGWLLASLVIATPGIAWYLVTALDARGVHPDVFSGLVSRSTLSQLTAIALGSLLALNETKLQHPIFRNWPVNWTARWPARWRLSRLQALSCLAIIVCLVAREPLQQNRWTTPEQSLCFQPWLIHFFGAGFMALGLNMIWLSKLPWMGYLGRISYGLYLYHLPIYASWGLAQSGSFQTWLVGLGALVSTLIVAVVSFHFIESPLIQWGRTSAQSPSLVRQNLGIVLTVGLTIACLSVLVAHRTQQPLASILNLAPKIPLHERRHNL